MKKIIFLLLIITNTINAQVPSYVPTNGLVGYWPFNGNANDESGNGNNGTINEAILANDRFGDSNKSYQFNHNSITLINTPQFNGSWSISLWYKRSTYSTGYENFGALFTTSSDIQFEGIGMWLLINEEKLYFQAGGDNSLMLTPYEYDTNWHNVIYTYDGVNLSLYVDSVNNLSAPVVITSNYTSSFNIGRGFDSFGNDFSFLGSIDDVGVWNRALTPYEIVGLNEIENTCQSLVINTGVLSYNPPTYQNTVTVYPNPANDQITIDCGNLANVSGWSIKITNMLGQEVFNQLMNTQQYVVPLNTWTGQGMYFVKILNAQNEVINIKKIIIQ
jgi:hypothetical protein